MTMQKLNEVLMPTPISVEDEVTALISYTNILPNLYWAPTGADPYQRIKRHTNSALITARPHNIIKGENLW